MRKLFPESKKQLKIAFAAAVGVLLAVTIGMGTYQGQQLEISRMSLSPTEMVPTEMAPTGAGAALAQAAPELEAATSLAVPEALKGKTIAVLSDLHGHISEDNAARLLEALREARPVAILLPGDMVDRRERYWPEARALMEALPDIAPTYYSFGNHEIGNIDRGAALGWLENLGIFVLRNSSAVLEVDGTPIILSGLDDRIGFASERSYILTMNRLRNASEYQILLSHRPEYASEYAAAGFDLVVSGHAHGGQVRLPFIGPVLSPHQGFFPDLAQGLHQFGNTQLVISRGLGNKIPFPRLFNPREVVLLGWE
ncbi:metallophosphoesterase [Acidaminobacter hydrogenoformans]|uniref:Calcineurin-like phosphoesterase domain-containing protein n=1 Tax=Acidaminobacter hydrogenoformans DSM 2784 TaxID=1120920 RepID=A0A1G5S5K7_9FIRM|nr:metallophosphoesterase [Acidaminobacter hydrogenoformans]SCZ81606.1 hypothetical protein SAMN03080599_02878 [Acidaminobacter hydrogenoformans DSM 2784]